MGSRGFPSSIFRNPKVSFARQKLVAEVVWQWHISWHCDNMNYVLKMVLPKCKECFVEVEIQVDCRHNFRNRQRKM